LKKTSGLLDFLGLLGAWRISAAFGNNAQKQDKKGLNHQTPLRVHIVEVGLILAQTNCMQSGTPSGHALDRKLLLPILPKVTPLCSPDQNYDYSPWSPF
jgi:hypothetical protein